MTCGLLAVAAAVFAVGAALLSRTCAVALIAAYRLVAPRRVRAACRFVPTCSEYAVVAIERWGGLRGWYLTAARLWRCRPPNGGDDWPPA